MENKEKFQKFAGVLQVISKIIFWVGVVGACVLVIFAVVIKLPFAERLLNKLFQSEWLNLSATINGFKISLQDFPVGEMLQLAFVTSVVEIFAMAIVLFLIWELIQILEAVKSGVPFTNEAVKHIYRLGYGIIAYSVVGGIGQGIMSIMFFQISTIQELLPSNIDFNINMTPVDFQILLGGLFVLLLGKIFEYGLVLQNEYDDTI